MPGSKPVAIDAPMTLAERRAFIKLPLEERRRQMAEQADRMVNDYARRTDVAERQQWQGGDIVDV